MTSYDQRQRNRLRRFDGMHWYEVPTAVLAGYAVALPTLLTPWLADEFPDALRSAAV
jgi:hypothetical protein